MGLIHPYVAKHNQILKGDLIMSDLTIQQFRFFLEDLENNLSRMDFLIELMSIIIDKSRYSGDSMSEILSKFESSVRT